MKKIKFVLLILFVLILTGCKGDYNLNIDKNLSLKETVNLYIDNKDDAYDKTLMLFENNNVDDSKYKVNKNDEYVIIHYEEDYKNFEDYFLNSLFYSRFISGEAFNKDDKSISYRSLVNLKLDDIPSYSNLNNSFNITNLKINLTIPFSIKENTADKVDGKTLTWELKKDDTFKRINFSFDFMKSNNLYLIIIILCFGIVLVSGFVFIRNYLRQKRL